MSVVQEVFSPALIAANGTFTGAPAALGGFVCNTSGTLSMTLGGFPFLTTMPVTAGVYYPLPFAIPAGATVVVTAAGGAGGILGVA